MVNSRAKGKRGELEFAKYLRGAGVAARRGQQFHGGTDSPDVVTDIEFVHFEVKRVEAGNPYNWLEQAKGDAKGKLPVVAHRRSDRDWIAVLPMNELLYLLRIAADNGYDRSATTSEVRSEEP